MERNEFDKVFRDRLEGMTEVAPDVWEGIERGLERRHRRVVMRRFATAAVAAAAGLAIALLVFREPRTEQKVEAPVQIAQSGQQELTPSQAAEPQEIAPIAEQVARFTDRQVTARAVVNKPAKTEPVTVETPAAEETPAVTETPVAEEMPAVTETPPVEETPATDTPETPQLGQEDLPADFWREDAESTGTHTSKISILSNLTTVASENDLIYKASPSHSSSQNGKSTATTTVEPISGTPKFFAPLSLGLQAELPLSGRFSIASGLTYTYLVSQYDMLVDKVRYDGAYNQLHYVGIPLTLSYHFVETPSFGFYGSVGGAAEKCVSQRYVYGSNTLHEKVGGLQWSARVGLGAEYWFVPRLGLYFDPSLVYYFDNSQPLSIRTQQPLQTRFEVGLRFKL